MFEQIEKDFFGRIIERDAVGTIIKRDFEGNIIIPRISVDSIKTDDSFADVNS